MFANQCESAVLGMLIQSVIWLLPTVSLSLHCWEAKLAPTNGTVEPVPGDRERSYNSFKSGDDGRIKIYSDVVSRCLWNTPDFSKLGSDHSFWLVRPCVTHAMPQYMHAIQKSSRLRQLNLKPPFPLTAHISFYLDSCTFSVVLSSEPGTTESVCISYASNKNSQHVTIWMYSWNLFKKSSKKERSSTRQKDCLEDGGNGENILSSRIYIQKVTIIRLLLKDALRYFQ